MARKKFKTNFPGVRYREHETRKHGVMKDRYFFIRYKMDGRDREEGLGWATEGWTAQQAVEQLAEIKKAKRTGEGAQTLQEKRETENKRRDAEKSAKEESKKQQATFGEIFRGHYLPHTEQIKKRGSFVAERALYRKWLAPVIADMPMKDVSQIHLERIRRNMASAGLSLRSIHYAMCVIRQTYNFARDFGLSDLPSPTAKAKALMKKVKAVDNARFRFLSHGEADRLLALLAKKSPDTHDQALLSLHCGLRASEVFNLAWVDTTLENGMLTLKDTKSGKTRAVYLTEKARDMLKARGPGRPEELIFPARGGGKRGKISNTFRNAVKELGLNNGITDPRQKIVFHSCRHSFASWLVQDGVDLYAVQKLMGHSELRMTERYAHLAPDTLRGAVKRLEASMERASKSQGTDKDKGLARVK